MPRRSSLSLLLLMFATPCASQEPGREPPLMVTLEIDGRTVEMELGGTATVTIDGEPRAVKLTAKAFRTFSASGVEFRYPSHFGYEFDGESPDVAIHTVEGPDTTVMVQEFAGGADSAAVAEVVLGHLREAYGESLENETQTSVRLGGESIRGRRLTANFAGERLRQDVVALPGTSTVLVFQTVLDDGAEPAETKALRKLLDETFRVTAGRGGEAGPGVQ